MSTTMYGRRLQKSIATILCASGLLMISACQQKMAKQPYFRPLEESDFFEDGRASRPLERGVVARGSLPEDHPLMTGLTPQGRKVAIKPLEGATSPALAGSPSNIDNFVTEFPFAMTESDLRRGLDRFTIYCTECHSPLGDGKGKIVERGHLKPPSYHTDLSRGFERFRKNVPLREAPVGYYYEVISKGFGGMAEYGSQIQPEDRWRIVAYIRVLLMSQATAVKDLPPELQATAVEAANMAEKKMPGGHQ